MVVPGEDQRLVSTGISVEIPEGHYGQICKVGFFLVCLLTRDVSGVNSLARFELRLSSVALVLMNNVIVKGHGSLVLH